MESITIREIIDQVSRGQIRIPAFQRTFVWEPERVAYLMDSLYKGYPFGSLLFWRTKQKLSRENTLGPFHLPDPKVDYPVDYVLDGQQRITAIFGVFQTDLPMKQNDYWQDIYFDLHAEGNPQDSQFVAVQGDTVNPRRYFPLKTLFDSKAYRQATASLDEDTAQRIDDMQSVFKEKQIPLQMSTTEDKATVALIFERINRQGVPLDTLQLLSAWTWSEDFQLQEEFEELADDLAPFGFADVGGDTNLILRCCSAILTGDAAPGALLSLNGQRVRDSFEAIRNGILYAVDYLRNNLSVFSIQNLPFSTMLVPLSVFFATEGNKEGSYTDFQRRQINRWFWRSAFFRRYSSAVLRNLSADISYMAVLREDDVEHAPAWDSWLLPEFFSSVNFGMGNVDTKTFILMLAQMAPRSFVSGTPVNLAETLKASNRTEYHHLMPKAFLKASGQDEDRESALANFAFLSRSDNREIGGVAPSSYRSKMAGNIDEILAGALCPASLFDDDYRLFLQERSEMLAQKSSHLMS